MALNMTGLAAAASAPRGIDTGSGGLDCWVDGASSWATGLAYANCEGRLPSGRRLRAAMSMRISNDDPNRCLPTPLLCECHITGLTIGESV